MTTLRQIVIDGYRESGITPVGETPDADEFDEGLRRLQSLIKSLFGYEFGEPLTSYNYGNVGVTNDFDSNVSQQVDSKYLPANTRLVCNITGAKSVYLNPNPQDGARFGILDNQGNFSTSPITIIGNGRRIETANTVVLNTNSLNAEWFYRADLGNWMKVTDLTASDNHPFPEEFDDLLSTLLAFRVNPRYGAQTSTEMATVMQDMKRKFRARYHQTAQPDSEYALLIIPSRTRAETFGFSNFSKGII